MTANKRLMYRQLKVPSRPPADVTNLRRLTPEEQHAQYCDVRSRMAEVSRDPNRPVAVAEEHPNLGGRRIFLASFQCLVRKLAACTSVTSSEAEHEGTSPPLGGVPCWRRASVLYGWLRSPEEELSDCAVEEIGMDFMEAAIVSVYGAVATVDVFCQEVMFEKLRADALSIGKPNDLVEALRNCLPGLTGKPKPTRTDWWPGFRNIHRARNSVTHAGANNPGKGRRTCESLGGFDYAGFESTRCGPSSNSPLLRCRTTLDREGD